MRGRRILWTVPIALLFACSSILGFRDDYVLDSDGAKDASDDRRASNDGSGDGSVDGSVEAQDGASDASDATSDANIGAMCSTNAECTGSVCRIGTCAPATCGNYRKDIGETDVDCGGACGSCTACVASADCASGRCASAADAGPRVCGPWQVTLAAGINDLRVAAVVTTQSGEVVVTGRYRGTFNGMTSPGTSAFVVKLDGEGTVLWSRALHGIIVEAAAVAVAPDGTVYVGGRYEGPLSAAGSNAPTPATPGSGGFIARFNPAGTVTTVAGLGIAPGARDQRITALAVGADGTLYAGGAYALATTPQQRGFLFASRVSLQTPAGVSTIIREDDYFTSPSDERTYEPSADNLEVAISSVGAIDVRGDTLAVVGSSKRQSDAGPDQVDGFVRSYRLNKTPIDSFTIGGALATGADGARGVAIDADGALLVTGYYSDFAAFPGQAALRVSGFGRDYFVAKFAAGSLVWRQAGFGIDTGENNGDDFGLGVVALGDGDAVILGATKSVKFRPDPGASIDDLMSVCCAQRFFTARFAGADGTLRRWQIESTSQQSYFVTGGIALRNGSGVIVASTPVPSASPETGLIRSLGRY